MTARFDGWRELSFGELVAHSAFGPRFGGDDYDDEGNVATLRTTDLEDDGRIDYATMPRARLEEAHFQQHFLQPGDLVITRSGTCGIAAVFCGFHLPVLPGAFLIRFRLTEGADPRFIAHYFNSSSGRQHILSVAKGAVQQNLNITNVEALRLQVPSIGTQRSIASSLGAYDDLIDNNRRRIKLLEDSVRLLFDEWFVRLRFPGHDSVKMREGWPEDWGRSTLQELCVAESGIQTGPFGSQLHQSDYTDEGVPVVMPKDLATFRVSTETAARIPAHLADELGRHRMQRGDIVFGRRGEIGRRAYIGARQKGYFCGTGCLRLRPDSVRVNPRFLFEILGAPAVAGEIANRAKGSTMANLSAGALQSVVVPVPPRQLQDQFAPFAEDAGEMIDTLEEQCGRLRAARDLLLPRLMSGELAV